MKKRNVLFFAISFITISALAGSPGVVINGVTWATCNVDAPGTFASNPEDAGMFYQWNSKVGWPSTGNIDSITATNGATTWNSSWNGGFTTLSTTDTWATANDPSPTGYRVPTNAELESLYSNNYVNHEWTNQNGVLGQKFTDIASGNSIFFPAVGCRILSDGSLWGEMEGYYWSTTGSDSDSEYILSFNLYFVTWEMWYRSSGLSIRSVLNNNTPVYNATASNLKIITINDKAEISGLPLDESVTVYNLQGLTIYNQKTTEETISVNLPARGMYIVKVGSQSLKVIN